MKILDIKSIAIIVLGVALIVAIILGQRKSNIDTHQNEITALNKENTMLMQKNDSLREINVKIDDSINFVKKRLDSNVLELTNTKLELNELKNKKNEIRTYVNDLSGNGVSNAFSDYIQTRTQSKNTN